MKLTIPETTRENIKEHYNDGDYSAISIEEFGNNEKRVLIRSAVLNGVGSEKVVKAIVKFYNKKQKMVSQLN